MNLLPQQLEFYSQSTEHARGICREQDPSVAESTLGCWDLHMQPGEGAFGLVRDFLITPHLMLYTDDYQNSVQVLGATRADTFSLSFSLNCAPGSNFYGQEFDRPSAIAGFDSCVDVSLGAGQQLLVVIMDRERLRAELSEGCPDFSASLWSSGRFLLTPVASALASEALLQLLHRSRAEPIPPVIIEQEVLDITRELLSATSEEGAGKRPGLALRRRGYEKALQHLEGLSDAESIRMGQLSLEAGVSQRTLEYAFREYAGCSPRDFLKRRRYHKIRRNLLTAQEGASVQDIAARQGIFEFGRMAGEYRRMFGESPSDSLARRFSRESFAYSA